MKPVPRFDIQKLYQKAKFEWLKPLEVLSILQNYDENLISPEPPNRPPGGTLFLFNRRVLRFFRKDGHTWRRKKDGRTIGEAHEQLKVNNEPVLSCYYAHGEENPFFQRRSYWMLDPAYEHIVLVHYRDVSEGRYSGSSSSPPEIISSTSSESTNRQRSYDLCSFSPGCAEKSYFEIESGYDVTDSGEYGGSGISSTSSQAQIHEALRNIEQHLISDDYNDDDDDYKMLHQPQVQVPFISELVDDGSETLGTRPPSLGRQPENLVQFIEDFANIEATIFRHSWPGKEDNVESPQKQLFSIREISPEWAFSSDESTKVIITGDFLLSNYSEINWKVMFGQVQVPAEIVQDGVVRCRAPAQAPGKVNVCLTSGNGESCSEVREFEYFEREVENVSASMSKEELLLLTRFARTLLLCGHGDQSSASDQWDHVMESLSGCSGSTSGVVHWLLQELLKSKLMQRLRPVSKSGSDPDCSLSREEKSILHIVSGLGFLWALNPVLEAGVGVNFRDSKGWTALHWAARFGREEMVSALIAAGAYAGAVTDPTAQDPVGETPASIAAVNGHKGLAGYLSEIALRDHLSSLTLEESEIPVEKIAGENLWLHESATEDLISLQYSLAAARSASQAAARIQAAFRAHSFRKKRERAGQQAHDECYLTPAEIHELSTAAICIQKKYRGWRRRSDFLKLRQHTLRIQAHVRGYQTRKKYKEMTWTVGVFEKAVLRWRRRGNGLRGFKVESEPIEEEDDEDILRVFRREKVPAALDVAVSRVFSMVESPKARHQFRRMVENYWLAKSQVEAEIGPKSASDLPPDDSESW